MILLLDFGNSRIKWGMADNGGAMMRCGAVDHVGTGLAAALESIVEGIDAPARMVVANVLGADQEILIQAILQSRYRQSAEFARSQSLACGVRSGYRNAAQLGVDRFLAMIGAHHHYPRNCLVIDCGTAVTIDALRASGEHLGGLITPGLRLMQSSLLKRASGIAAAESAKAVLFGVETGEALAGGCLRSLVGGIESIVADMICELNSDYKCVLCGGDAVQLAPMFNFEPIVDSDLVLKGLAVWAKQ